MRGNGTAEPQWLPMSQNKIEQARAYLRAIEEGATGAALARFFTQDATQTEFPNRLTPGGAERSLDELLAGAVQGQKVLQGQKYDVLQAYESGDTVILEVQWSGTLAIPIGSLQVGDVMKARFAVFLEYRGDLIYRQRNYDCFDPF